MNRYSRGFVAIALVVLVVVALFHLAALAGLWAYWSAMVALGLLGWASGMIFAIAYHVMPVFLARDFPTHAPLRGHFLVFGLATLWLTLAHGLRHAPAIAIGYALYGGSGAWFVYNLFVLIREGTPRPAGPPPAPFAEQRAVDRAAIQATRIAPFSLVGAPLLLAAVYADWVPGRWHLAGEHWIVLGWLMPMVMGVAYHILPRFSHIQTRSIVWVRTQLYLHLVAVPCIVIGLGASVPVLFTIGAAIGGSSLLLFLWNILPTLSPLPQLLVQPHHIIIREVAP
jgi:hypothetical protein